MPNREPQFIREAKIQARRILKDLKSSNATVRLNAAAKIASIPNSRFKTAQDVLEFDGKIKLKYALAAVVISHGYTSWQEFLRVSQVGDEMASPAESMHFPYVVANWQKLRDFFVEFEMRNPSEVARTLAESSWDDDEDESLYDDPQFLRSTLANVYSGVLNEDLMLRVQDWGVAEELLELGIITHVLTDEVVYRNGQVVDHWPCEISDNADIDADTARENLVLYNDRYYSVITDLDGGIVVAGEKVARALPRFHAYVPFEYKEEAILEAAVVQLRSDDLDLADVVEREDGTYQFELIVPTGDSKRYYGVALDADEERVVAFHLVDAK